MHAWSMRSLLASESGFTHVKPLIVAFLVESLPLRLALKKALLLLVEFFLRDDPLVKKLLVI